MTDPVIWRMPALTCPTCGDTIDAHGEADTRPSRPPASGDTTLCVYCGAWLLFTDGLGLRCMTAADKAALDPTQHALLVRAEKFFVRRH